MVMGMVMMLGDEGDDDEDGDDDGSLMRETREPAIAVAIAIAARQ
jgi:hypothetical protein